MDTALGVGYSRSYFAHSLSDAWLYINQVRRHRPWEPREQSPTAGLKRDGISRAGMS